MFTDDTRLSLADLAGAGIRLFPFEAVTIAREVLLQVARGDVPGVPSAHVIRLGRAGTITVEGPVAAGGRAVSRAAQLLDALLPPKDAGPEFKVPGALRLCIVRALGMLDVPPYPSLDSFADALQRFAAPDSAVAIRRIVARYESEAAAPAERIESPLESPPPIDTTAQPELEPRRAEPKPSTQALARTGRESLTISDIRRARRATGLSLSDVSERSRIPASLLRQLEWGYLLNWPVGLYGRTQLVRYARAAGLDEQIVIATVWPMLEEVEREMPAAETAVEAVSVSHVEAPEVSVEPLPIEVPRVVEVPRVDVAEVPLARTATILADEPLSGTGSRGRVLRTAVALAIAATLLLVLSPLASQRYGLSPADLWKAALSTPPQQTATPAPATPPAPLNAEAARPEPSEPADVVPAPASAPSAEAVKAARTPEGTVGTAAPATGLTDAETAWSPSFAAAGTAMFYHAEGERGSALMRADTTAEGTTLRITRIVDDNSRNFHARPSPDGAQIAFDSDRDGERGVYIANSDGTNVRRVSGDGFAAVPSWSPDGTTLAFVRAESDKPRVWNLWTLDLKTGEMERLTSNRYGQMWGASWFPDGRHVAYSHEFRIVILDTLTGRERSYQTPRKGKLVRTPAVSPDGNRIMFQVYQDGAWLLEVEDGSMRKVLADPSAEEYSWSPDGRRVAYHSRRSGEWGVWLMTSAR